MKRLAFVLMLFAFSAAGTASSQTYGIKGGANIAMLNRASSTDAALYFHTGFYVRECLESYNYRRGSNHNRFFFQPELTYSRQGASLEDSWGDEYWFKNDYVNLGLIFQYRPIRKLGVEFGPQMGYLVLNDVTEKWVGKKNKYDVDNQFRKMDYALCFGIVYNTGSFCDFSFRYNMGLNDIVKHNNGKSIRNGVCQFSMLIDLW